MRCILVGECMVEFAPVGQPGLFRQSMAGDTFNTAWYLARHAPHLEISYLTAVGRDKFSDRFLDQCDAAGIGRSHVARHPERPIGLYVVTLEGAERSFSYWRSNSAARTLADDPRRLDAGFAQADLIYFSGITAAIVGPEGRARLFEAVAKARTRGARIIFDPNLRPALWADACEMRAAVTEAAGTADIVMPSFEDEQTHFGDATPLSTLDRYGACGAATVIVKNGAAPVRYLYDGVPGSLAIEASRNVVDTTAAGDSFNAGCLGALTRGADIASAVAAGAALSARVIEGRGALVEIESGDF